MKKIGTKKDCEVLRGLPPPVLGKIEETIALLNFYYGENRDIDKDLGGYVLLIETQEDLKEIKNFLSMDSKDIVPEFTDIIKWNDENIYTISLMLISSDFSVTLIIPYQITPITLLKDLTRQEAD